MRQKLRLTRTIDVMTLGRHQIRTEPCCRRRRQIDPACRFQLTHPTAQESHSGQGFRPHLGQSKSGVQSESAPLPCHWQGANPAHRLTTQEIFSGDRCRRPGLVQQTVQIVAAHDLTLFVRPLGSIDVMSLHCCQERLNIGEYEGRNGFRPE